MLDAALALFAERTYAGTAVPAVAERAGTGVGTIYRYFPSKEALGNAVYRRCQASLRDRLRLAAPPPRAASVRRRFRAYWTALSLFAREEPAAHAFLEHQQHAAYLDRESRRLAAEVDELAHALLRDGQVEGVVRDADPALLGALVSGAFVGLTKAARAGAVRLGPATLALAEQAAWDLVRAPGSEAEG